VVCVAPLERPNAGWIIKVLERAMQEHGTPTHIISGQASIFVGDVFAEPLKQRNIKPRLGAVGKRGSIAVTGRVIKTLKYEWHECVPVIKGFDHLRLLCAEFENWCNAWRPHMTLEGLRPDDSCHERSPQEPTPDAKNVPCGIKQPVSVPPPQDSGYHTESGFYRFLLVSCAIGL
jgi:transposase InsO family protein